MEPTYQIIADSKNITELVKDRLVELVVTDKAGVKADQCVITIDDRDQLIELPSKGAKLEISLGYVGQPLAKMGSYIVDTVEVENAPRLLTITATSADMGGTLKAPKERSFHGIPLLDLVKTVATENKLDWSVAPELAGRMIEHVDQTESDMQLLTRICSNMGAVCKVADGKIIIAGHAKAETTGGKTGEKKKLPLVTINGAEIRWRATLADRNKYKTVKAFWHDKAKGERVEIMVGAGAPELTLKQTYPTEKEAEDAASSKLSGLNRSTGTISIQNAVGDTSAAAEREADLIGFRAGVDGKGWIITSVVHRLRASSGYTISIEAERK